MDRSSKYIFGILFVLFCITVGYRYDQYILKRNYILKVNVTCNPVIEDCFESDCDNTDPKCNASTYKKVSILAHDAPKCLEEHNCENFTCSGINSCEITNCNSDALESGEKCTNPINN